MKEFKARCSAIGQIMANGRGKDTAGATCYGYLQDWVVEQLFGVRRQLDTKPMAKGRAVEDAAIEFAGANLGWFMPEKNERLFENDFITGTPDIVEGTSIVDIKSSWDAFTFPLWDSKPPMGYVYQLQGYMALTGLKHAQLVYVLMPTPEEICGEVQSYDHVPAKYRIKAYEIKRDDALIEAIYDRVQMCRNIIEVELLTKLK